jgi:hypothetical protein
VGEVQAGGDGVMVVWFVWWCNGVVVWWCGLCGGVVVWFVWWCGLCGGVMVWWCNGVGVVVRWCCRSDGGGDGAGVKMHTRQLILFMLQLVLYGQLV